MTYKSRVFVLKGSSYDIVWDIERLFSDIDSGAVTCKTERTLLVNINDYSGNDGNDESLLDADITERIVIFELADRQNCLVNGVMAKRKAEKLGIITAEVLVIPFSTHRRYIFNYDKELYKSVINEYK